MAVYASLSHRSFQAFINFWLTRSTRRPFQCSDYIQNVEVKRSVLRPVDVIEVLYASSFSWFLQARWGVVFQQITRDRLRSCCPLVQLYPINTDNINNGTNTRYVILSKHWMWLPVDGFMWTETRWSRFYNFNYFNNLRML